MKYQFIMFILFFSLTVSVYSNEIQNKETNTKDSIIEYFYGKGFYKNNRHIFSNKDFINALSPVPEAVKLFKKSQGKFAASLTFLGIGITAAISHLVLNTVFYDYPFTLDQNLLYQMGYSLLVGLDSISLVMFIVFLVIGIAQRYSSILLYNTAIIKKISKEISYIPKLEFDHNSFTFFLNFKV